MVDADEESPRAGGRRGFRVRHLPPHLCNAHGGCRGECLRYPGLAWAHSDRTTLRYAHVRSKNLEDALDRVGDFMRATGADHRISAAVPTVRPYPTGGGNGVYPWAMRGVADGKSRGSSCGRGEIGRRSGLKIRFPFGSAGSSPAVRTRRTCCFLLPYVGLETGPLWGRARLIVRVLVARVGPGSGSGTLA